MAYERNRISGSVCIRWVDRFPWVVGMYAGPVPSYGVADLNGGYRSRGTLRPVPMSQICSITNITKRSEGIYSVAARLDT